MERRMGPRERALQSNTPGNTVSQITRATLLLEIKKFKTYPTTIGMDTKKAVLLNLILGYLNDPEIVREVWASGIDSLGPALEAELKKK